MGEEDPLRPWQQSANRGIMAQQEHKTGTPVIELRNVSKTFGEVRSLANVDFSVHSGEIVGLLGDNGAGKSTLVKTVMGYHVPDPGGEIHFEGKLIVDWSVARARALGIETVYQERALCEKQPIWRNMFMGREPRNRWGLIDVARMRSESARLMSQHMGFTSAAVHPDNIVTTMSGGEKQGVAITRALYFDARLVILDEPTMGLSLSETKEDARFRGGNQTGRQNRRYLSITTSFTFILSSTASMSSIAAGLPAFTERARSQWTSLLTNYTALRAPAPSTDGRSIHVCQSAFAKRPAEWHRPAARQPRRPAFDHAPLWFADRHYRGRHCDVARLRRRGADSLSRHRYLQGLRTDNAAVCHHCAGSNLRRHYRRNRPCPFPQSWLLAPQSFA